MMYTNDITMKRKACQILEVEYMRTMQKPKYKNITDFVFFNKQKEKFDLKEQFNEELWWQHLESLKNGDVRSRRKDKTFYGQCQNELTSIVGEKPLINFLLYKSIPDFCAYDCDGTILDNNEKQEYCAWLTREIYRILWKWNDIRFGEEEGYENAIVTRYGYSEIYNMELGPDTMNSFWITLCAYLCSNFDTQYRWNSYKNTFLFRRGKNGTQAERARRLATELRDDSCNSIEYEIVRFAANTHTIGNMVLVPVGYNGYRGTKDYLKDYFDLSLDNLRYSWDKNVYLGTTDEQRKYNFIKYINVFFLWDYVDERYDVIPMCKSHKKILEDKSTKATYVLPKKSEIIELCKYINFAIERRGIFMSAMLEIALHGNNKKKGNNQKGSNLYIELVNKVFLCENRMYSGYTEVFQNIYKVVENLYGDHQELKQILTRAEEKINSIK